jgi:polysaccharide chain length determinant protein (PEP-CTERM system associated)
MNIQETSIHVLNQLRGMWRYRWHMIFVAWLIALPGWTVVYLMPDIYEATAKVSVDTNSLLPNLTKGLTAGESMDGEVELISKSLLTRPMLTKVANDSGLSSRAKNPQEMEDLIASMQRLIILELGRDLIFTISFRDRNRLLATAVVSELLDAFVQLSLGAQGDDADMTERAIRSELDDHEERLLRAEADLADFKKENLGYMPDEGVDYYTRLQAAITSAAKTENELRKLTQRRQEVARQLQGETSLLDASSSSAKIVANCSKAASIGELRGQLSALQVDFTDKHPRIVMLRDTIVALEAECQREIAETGGVIARSDSSAEPGEVNSVYQNLRLQLSNTDVEMASLQEQLRTQQQQVSKLRIDVDKIGTVERDLKKLNRDYGVVETRYQELLRRWETLRSMRRLDPVTGAVQFKIIGPPFAAADPVAPHRELLLVAVLVVAFGAGGFLAFGLNQLNIVYFTRRDIGRAHGIPVLGSVSMIMSTGEIAALNRRHVAWAGANLALVVVGIGLVVLAKPITIFVRDLSGSGL